MFGKLFELGSLMKQAQQFGGKVQEINEKLKQLRIEGQAGAGLVRVEVNGLQEMISCKIDPALFGQGDAELMEELILSAVNAATEESRRRQAESMQSLTEGVDMGSLGDALGKIMPK